MFQESHTTPWASGPEWSGTADVLVNWLQSNKGNADCLFVSDGRSRSCRKKIDKIIDNPRHAHEAWIVFKPTQRLGRRVAYAADNKEIILVSMPLSRTQLSAAPREQMNSAGEETTHETSYTGAVPIPWGALPLLTPADKAKIVGRFKMQRSSFWNFARLRIITHDGHTYFAAYEYRCKLKTTLLHA